MIKIKIKLVKMSNFVKNNLKLFDNTNVMGGCYTEAVYHYHNNTTRCTGTFRFYCYGNADCDSHVVMRNIFKCDVCGAKNWYWKNGETNIDDDLPQSWTGPLYDVTNII